LDGQFFFDMERIFKDLNPEQQEAVNCLEGSLLIMAGAGSGKTRALTCRIANLIAHDVPPWNILAITFTNKAANEMKARAEKLIGVKAKDVWISTFHSLCAQLLRREIEIAGEFNRNFAIFTASDSKTIIKQCIAELRLDEERFSAAQFKISDLKNELIDWATYKEQARYKDAYTRIFANIYELYQKKLRENNALDFDDLIFYTVKIFKQFPDVLEKYQDRFKYISVDEYQDTNVAQYILTKLLAAKYQNLCVVGDADQSIYGWRGADMRNILNFEKDYPKAQVVLLEQNYRSTKTILNAANAVIRHNKDRKPKNLWTQNEGGEKIRHFECEGDLQEAEIVAREIQRLVAYENFYYNDIALLYRTNAQSRLFEEKFMQESIPYIVVGGLKFYDRKEIRDIVAYLHVIANPLDDLHLLRIINVPSRKLGSTNVSRLAEFAYNQGLSILEVVTDKNLLEQVPGLTQRFRVGVKNFAAMLISFTESAKNLSLDKLINLVLEESGYYEMLRQGTDDGKRDGQSRKENLGAFIDSAKEFDEKNHGGSLEDFLNHVALITDIDSIDEKESRVKLMTVHTAKGLEFPVVFVVGMEDGLFPHANALHAKDSEKEIEEERRACYVALTRAEKKLYITSAQERMFFGKKYEQEISRFVKEIPPECFYSTEIKSKPAQKKFSPPKSTYKAPTAYHAPQMKKPEQKKSASNVVWKAGDRLNHKIWGMGTVMATDGNAISVLFANPKIGLKKLKISAAPINKI